MLTIQVTEVVRVMNYAHNCFCSSWRAHETARHRYNR